MTYFIVKINKFIIQQNQVYYTTIIQMLFIYKEKMASPASLATSVMILCS